MREINCPYYWDCGKNFNPSEMKKDDFEFLKSATEKKITFMFLHCPKCKRRYKFDTVKWEADEFGFSDPNIVVEKKKKTTKQLMAILNKAKIEIPTPYLEYLIKENFNPKVSVFVDEDDFNLYNLNELCEKVNVDGKSNLRIRELKGYVDSLKEIIEETPKRKKAHQFTLDELSNCLTIGYENTRILFIDNRDNNSLWIFHSDGGDTFEITSMKLDKIIVRKNKPDRADLQSVSTKHIDKERAKNYEN
ncbi:hypothetical protein HYN56_23200 [Flavobacterium crocinum]|uniref:Uncharacterized protein n=1 Tax=Flavobacterium crocinum TaxID=2183896 RepID=A0A2S1YT90_9FLAO|nr:hypothetical protein [Flavobacterium crocinum]AWK06978.1 hypothetical protein HYN56_23200 [Flavobacterium crocinum]